MVSRSSHRLVRMIPGVLSGFAFLVLIGGGCGGRSIGDFEGAGDTSNVDEGTGGGTGGGDPIDTARCSEGDTRSCACDSGETGLRHCRDGRFAQCQCSGGGTSCGNGRVDGDEMCDGDDLQGESCQSITMGQYRGALRCGAGCTFDMSFCVPFGTGGFNGEGANIGIGGFGGCPGRGCGGCPGGGCGGRPGGFGGFRQ